MNLCYVDIQNTKYQKLSNDLPLKIKEKWLTDLKKLISNLFLFQITFSS